MMAEPGQRTPRDHSAKGGPLAEAGRLGAVSVLGALAIAGCGKSEAASEPASGSAGTSLVAATGGALSITTSARGGLVTAATVTLEARGAPVVIEAVGLEGTPTGLTRLGASVVRTGGREDTTVTADRITQVLRPRRPGAAPVEGLRIEPGRVDVQGRPARGAEATDGPWRLLFTVRADEPGAHRLGTAVIAYAQAGEHKVLRARVDFTVRARQR